MFILAIGGNLGPRSAALRPQIVEYESEDGAFQERRKVVATQKMGTRYNRAVLPSASAGKCGAMHSGYMAYTISALFETQTARAAHL